MNKELLERVKQHILEEPKRLKMGSWGRRVNPLNSDYPACGTVGCIGGWSIFLAEPKWLTANAGELIQYCEVELPSDARRLLELERDQAARLFCTDEWPEGFHEQYNDAVTYVDRARITAARIDHFIATEGRE